MSRNTFRAIILLATISIVGISLIQVYWFRQAFNIESQQFDREVRSSLHEVANRFFEINKAAIPSDNLIRQMSSNYYVVMINNEIDANLLEFLLKTEFERRGLTPSFEYGIYDCTNDEMVYGSYISFDSQLDKPQSDLPKWENQSYYFGVNFPSKNSVLLSRLEIWTFSTVVLIIVILFFGYSLFVIFRQRRLSETQKDFINNITHEFKTPLSTIALSAEVLKKENIRDQPERLREYAGIIDSETKRLRRQVERVLDLAHAEEKLKLNQETVFLKDILKDVLNGLQLIIKEKEATINVGENFNDWVVRADSFHLTNVLYNLIDNAIKYVDGRPEIVLSAEDQGSRLRISIADNGLGIPKGERSKIWQRFYRVNTGNVHNVKGFGLGLAYVKQVVKAMGGTVSLQKSDESGSIFILELPKK